ncbi:hypothetical protein SDC9_179093 [bioreactor metagenome]|uniref:Uncharacterized protein n=1 Tax=bioreactor metagenome TaxID=1076179 RepID=A0A645H0W0_9ZZZZ
MAEHPETVVPADSERPFDASVHFEDATRGDKIERRSAQCAAEKYGKPRKERNDARLLSALEGVRKRETQKTGCA